MTTKPQAVPTEHAINSARPQGPYSEFTINKAFGGKATLQGKLSVVVGAELVTGTFRAMGPKPAQNGGRDYYDIVWTPDNAALAARQTQMQRGELALEQVPNANQGFELRTVGWGKLFEFTAEERANPKFTEHGIEPSFRGAIRVLTPQGPRDVDLFATHKKGKSADGKAYDFDSGSANLHDPVAAQARRDQKAAAAVQDEAPTRRPRKPKGDAGSEPANG